jgi:hypothetical protein
LLRDACEPAVFGWVGAGPATEGGMGFIFQPYVVGPEDTGYFPVGGRIWRSADQVSNVEFFDADV